MVKGHFLWTWRRQPRLPSTLESTFWAGLIHVPVWEGRGSQSTLSTPSACLSPPGPGRGQPRRRGKQGRSVGEAGTESALQASSWAQGCDSSSYVWTCLRYRVPGCVWLSLSPECACVCAYVCVSQCVCVCVCGEESLQPTERNRTRVEGRRRRRLGLSEPGQVLSCAGLGPQLWLCWLSAERGQVPGLQPP